MTEKKNTLILKPTKENIQKAAKIIRSGGLVAFPTETVYGLGADAMNAEAVGRIYEAKGRPSDNPMIVHISRASDIGQLTRMLSPEIVEIIDNFWPGPLTIVVKKRPEVPDRTTGGLDTVAVRLPDSRVARDLISESLCPIAAPSANLSGGPSPTRAKDVIADMMGRVDAIIEGDDCRVGIESTVLDLTGDEPTILRPGIITAEAIEAALGKKVRYDKSLTEASEHVQFIVEGERGRVKAEIERLKKLNEGIGNSVGVILFEEKAFLEAAHDFFARLRDLDNEGVDMILAGALSDSDGVGFAVMNRMLKSAGYNIVKV